MAVFVAAAVDLTWSMATGMNEVMNTGFLGAGRMAGAIIRGLLAAGKHSSGNLRVYDPHLDTVRKLAEETGICVVDSAAEACEGADAVLLCVKPDQAASALAGCRHQLAEQLLISIVTGVSCARLEEWAPGVRTVRVMPNTAALVRQGVAAICAGSSAGNDDVEAAKSIFSAVGDVYEVREAEMDAITALSGSGPAFLYLAAEAMVEGGVRAGLSRVLSGRLVSGVVSGAAAMMGSSGLSPAELREMVTSPGGTTAAGLHELESSAIRAAFSEAVVAARDRARELSAQ